MKIDKVSFVSFCITATTLAIYLAITRLSFDQGIKWRLFGAHLVLAPIGVLMGAWTLKRRRWEGILYASLCGYIAYIQFAS